MSIEKCKTQSDGKRIVFGDFEGKIKRVTADGQLDDTFRVKVDCFGKINDIDIDRDDNIYLAGNFTTINDSVHICVAKLDRDGNVFKDWRCDLNAMKSADSIKVLPSGRIRFVLTHYANGSKWKTILLEDGRVESEHKIKD